MASAPTATAAPGPVPFTKMHGIGNDYVYINGFEHHVPDPAAMAEAVSDRHFGVGSDGLILVLPPSEGVEAHAKMRMFNADGSEAQMCGNGIRCVAKLVHDRGISRCRPLRIETGAGVLSLDYALDRHEKVQTVTVDMGEPILPSRLVPAEVPGVDPDDPVIGVSLEKIVQWPPEVAADWIDACGFDQKMTCVSMGNPHAVMYCEKAELIELDHIGPALEHHPVFPERVNAHFYSADSRAELTMRTWERGSGITLACGTGACAVCVAAVLTGRADRAVLIHLPGGDLELEWRESDNHVYMTGSATEVFSGTWAPPA